MWKYLTKLVCVCIYARTYDLVDGALVGEVLKDEFISSGDHASDESQAVAHLSLLVVAAARSVKTVSGSVVVVSCKCT